MMARGKFKLVWKEEENHRRAKKNIVHSIRYSFCFSHVFNIHNIYKVEIYG